MSGKRFLGDAYADTSADETRALYDAWSEVYDTELVTENAYAQPQRCAAALAAAAPNHDVAVLDIGCGTGLSGLALRAAGFSVLAGCDLSPGMMLRAMATGVYSRLFETDLNAPPMPVADGSFGAATAVGVFTFGHVRADALDEILRVLRPGAPLIIGLNEKYYAEGSLTRRMAALSEAGQLDILSREKGEHIPGTGVEGWVLTMRKSWQIT
ncbi:MAG: class I SAM-dependent methyltransferase [Minwuia sp.]|nr:class I SAM-dependent methyltransferase [Minwuia sp.]